MPTPELITVARRIQCTEWLNYMFLNQSQTGGIEL